jgi:DDE superfamily endonuclease
MARISKVFEEMKEGELFLADLGYVGESALMTPIKRKHGSTLTAEEVEINKLISKFRIKVENVLAMVKNFGCLSIPWRSKFIFILLCGKLPVML